MNDKMIRILVQAAGRNALQLVVGFGAGLWWASKNMEAVGQIQVLIAALAPILVCVGGPTGLVLSVFNSLGLWQEDPPAK
jgi:hypothetical protein